MAEDRIELQFAAASDGPQDVVKGPPPYPPANFSLVAREWVFQDPSGLHSPLHPMVSQPLSRPALHTSQSAISPFEYNSILPPLPLPNRHSQHLGHLSSNPPGSVQENSMTELENFLRQGRCVHYNSLSATN